MTQKPKNSSFQLIPRNRDEIHRAATPLELMFDLAAVIAIAAAATGLHHAVAEAHFFEAIIGFVYSFFMIYMAWMNYTWFASTYDNRSVWFRINSMVIMFGALVLAAGIPAVFAGTALYLALAGFIIMRVGLVAFWVAAARGDSEHRETANTYAVGIIILQIYWTTIILTLTAGSTSVLIAFFFGFVAELILPVFADKKSANSWHRHHLIERFGLLNIIVLGECFLAVVLALNAGTDGSPLSWDILAIGLWAAVITFLLWALYFSDTEHLHKDDLSHVFLWGYGHFVLFAAAAAAGAGFAVMVELATHHAHISAQGAALSVAIPVAAYVISLWAIRDRCWLSSVGQVVMISCSGLIVLVGVVEFFPLVSIAVILAALTLFRSRLMA